MDSGCVGENRFNVSQIDPESDWPSPFPGSILPELDQAFAIEFRQPETPKLPLEERKAGRFGTPDPLAYFTEIVPMLSNEVS